MKKIHYKIFTAIVLVIFLSGCAKETWNKNISFESKSVNNVLNNVLAGGHMAYVSNKLYISYEKTLYEISGGNRITLDNSDLNVDNVPYGPIAQYFNYNDELYAIPISDDINVLMKYDTEKNKFVETDMQVNPNYNSFYLSDNLCVFKGNNWYDMYVRNKDKEIKVDNKTDHFSVYNNVVYYTTDDGKLYSFSPNEKSPKSKFIDKLSDEYVHTMYVVKNACYYLISDEIYKYSFIDGTTSLITDDSVYQLTTFNDTLYYSTIDDGIYKFENGQKQKN